MPDFCFHLISCEKAVRFSPNFIYTFLLTRSRFMTSLKQSYGPWFMSEFHFRSVSLEQMDRIWPNFINAFILTRSVSIGFLPVIFYKFVTKLQICKKVGPWLATEFCFCAISWRQMDRISSNFVNVYILIRYMLGLLSSIFCLFVTEV